MAYDADLNFNFIYRTKIVFGAGSVREAPIEVAALGGTRVLLVTDAGVVKAGLAKRVEEALGQGSGVTHAGTYSDVPSDSSIDTVERGAALGRELKADAVVSLGGGSVIDTAKGIAICLGTGHRLVEHEGCNTLSKRLVPHVVIPTTAGTGSEVSYAAVIKDAEKHRKILFVDWFIIPDAAILDPELTAGLPAKLTAATGMDALTHAVESIHSLQREPIADALALHAIRLIKEYLPQAVDNGKDLHVRGQMLIAANIAGCAFSNAQVGLVHAMAHTAGARFGIHHGLANSIFLPHVIRYNGDACADRYRLVAEAMGVDTRAMNDETAVEAAARACADLAARCGLTARLRDVGVLESAITEELAEATTYDGSIVYNPKFVGEAASLIPVYKAAW